MIGYVIAVYHSLGLGLLESAYKFSVFSVLSVVKSNITIACCLFILSLNCEGSELSIASFSTVKVIHALGEPVKFQAEIAVSDSELLKEIKPVTLQLAVQSGLRKPQVVFTQSLSIEDPTVEWETSWTPPRDQEWGLFATLTLSDAKGEMVDSEGAIFEVTDNWVETMRFATITSWTFATPATSESEIKDWILRARNAGVNTIEAYAWMPASYYFQSDQKSWPRYHLPFSAELISREKLKTWSRLLHENGMKFVAYNETSAVKGPESWKVYKPKRKYFIFRDLEAPYYKDLGMFLPNALMAGQTLGENLNASIREFGWDGILMDSNSQAMLSTAYGVDKSGQRLTTLKPGEVGRQYMKAIRSEVDKVKPDFKYLSQNAWASLLGRHWHFRKPLDQIPGVVREYYEDEKWDEFSKLVDTWSTESNPEQMREGTYASTYDRLAVTLNTTIEVTRKPLLLWAYISQWNHEGGGNTLGHARPYLSTVLASRSSFNDAHEMYGGATTGDPKGPVNELISRYRNFAARYSEYLFDPVLEWDHKPWQQFEVKDIPGNVEWKHTVYHRKLPNGKRRTIVNLLNLPEDQHIVMEHALPAPVKEYTLFLKHINKQVLPKVWVISPDFPGMNAIPVDVEIVENGKGAVAKIERDSGAVLDAWNVVVIED